MTLTKASYSMINGAPVNVLDYGATGDGVTDDTAAIQSAIAACQLNYGTLVFPTGHYVISSQIELSGNPIVFMGQSEAVWQRGSNLTNVALIWTGGAEAMFRVSNTDYCFSGFNVLNKGGATDFIEMTAGSQRIRLVRMSFDVATGANEFSRSIIYSDGNRVGYSEFNQIYCLAAAPKFIYIDGKSTPNGITPFAITGRSIFESSPAQAMTVVYVKDETIDQLSITNCTFNQNIKELTIIDTTDTPDSITINALTFSDNEWDTSSGLSTHRMMRLTNVPNFICDGNHLQGGGSAAALIDLVNSNVSSFKGNYALSIDGPIFNADATSYTTVGQNFFSLSNTKGVLNSTANGLINVSWVAGDVYFDGNLTSAERHTVYRVSPTSGAGWSWASHTAANGFATVGQIITVMIKNTSGGAISAGVPDGSWKLASAPTAPANGYSRSYTFVWDGAHFVELYRSAADVPN